MRRIHLRDGTYQALRGLALGAFRQTAERQPDGSWLVPLADDTWDRLAAQRLPGESDDDVVARVIHLTKGGRLPVTTMSSSRGTSTSATPA
jgi:hypothetical protein